MNKRDSHKQKVIERVLLHGRLKNVSLRYRTAKLHRYNEKPVPLCFDAKMDHKMIRLRDKYIEVRGHGVINEEEDRWESVQVERARHERNSVDELLNNPKPKIFDPDDFITLDLTDEEWEGFDRAIRESRDK